MSATITPNVPAVETPPHPAIVASQTPLDVANVILSDPAVESVVDKYTGATAHTPFVSLLSAAVTDVATQYGLHLTSNESMLAAIVIGGVAGYGYQWMSKKTAPATPTTQGTTPHA